MRTVNRPGFDAGFMVESLAESTVALLLWALGWIVYWLSTLGLWFLGGRLMVGIFIAALKSTTKRQYMQAVEAYKADHRII
jgi:hypothetical protein